MAIATFHLYLCYVHSTSQKKSHALHGSKLRLIVKRILFDKVVVQKVIILVLIALALLLLRVLID